MVCSKCGLPLRVIKGGQKVVDGKIVMVHVLGCMNTDCELKMQEQNRIETPQESFAE